MADYREMYYELLFESNKIIDQLIAAQKRCDEIYNATATPADRQADDRRGRPLRLDDR